MTPLFVRLKADWLIGMKILSVWEDLKSVNNYQIVSRIEQHFSWLRINGYEQDEQSYKIYKSQPE